MPCPFPGMDPYLEEEANWPTFHHHLAMSLYHLLLPNLVDRYRARVGTRSYVTEQALFTSITREEHHEEYVEIRLRADSRPTTLINLVAPTNRTTQRGRQEYLAFREAARQAGASVIDIDLLIEGTPLLSGGADQPGGTVSPAHDYSVTVVRGGPPPKVEVYSVPLAKPLPRFKLPLGRNDRDLVVDLEIVFNRAYDQGGFANRVDYTRPTKTPVRDSDRLWIDQLLKVARFRDA